MNDRLRRRFWAEAGVAIVSSALFLLTLVWKDWIEIVFNVDPDRYNGSFEWLIVVVSLAIAVAAVAVARQEWRRAATLARA